MSQVTMGTDACRPPVIGQRPPFNRVPDATYRLQFHADFTLDQARQIVGYLHQLGITDIYASPLFRPAPGSTHGYDICSHGEIGKHLGGMDAFQKLTTALHEHGMGLLLDVVPNHMGTHATNAWWWDVLKHGRSSRYAHFFEIDWDARAETLAGKVLLPVLGAPLTEVIDELKLLREDGEWLVTYYDMRFPIAPRTPIELLDVINVNGNKDGTRNAMLAILDAQHYRLAYWRALNEINYRRFFDVSSLVALRMEDEEVFRATHQKVFQLIENGQVTGLRVDHPDGLRDPREYFQWLQDAFGAVTADNKQLYVVAEKILAGPERLPADWPVAGTTGYDFLNQVNGLFVAAENEPAMTDIYREFAGGSEDFRQVAYLSRKRVLDLSFAAEVNSLARAAHGLFNADRTRRDLSLEELRFALGELIACFPTYRTYVRKSSRDLCPRDLGVINEALRAALEKAGHLAEAIHFVASLLTFQFKVPAEQEADALEFILKFQQLTGPAAAKGIEDTAYYNYHRLVALNEVGGDPDQFGISVPAFHRANGLRAEHWPHSLNATMTHDTKRGEDARSRISVLSEMPGGWRSAVFRWRDVNARYKTVLRGEPAPDANDEYLFYQALVGAWPAELLAAPGLACPERLQVDERMLSNFRARIGDYMLKAIREAKRQTSWTDASPAYEQATGEFVKCALASGNSEFLADFMEFNRSVAFFGAINSLSQTLLKLTSPGVPDVYQGTELCDLSLVDPDNRRAVDYEERRRLLESFKDGARMDFDGDDLLSGKVKMFLLWKVLNYRQAHRELFNCGNYRILRTTGARSNHLCAFARAWRDEYVAVICPRLCWILNHGEITSPCSPESWLDEELDLTDMPARRLRNVLTGEDLAMDAAGRIPIAEVLRTFPVALLATS